MSKLTKYYAKAKQWYETPLEFKVRLNKSTVIIFLLLIYILTGHAWAEQSHGDGGIIAPRPISQIQPISAPSFKEQGKLPTLPIEQPQTPQRTAYNGSGDPDLDWIISHESGGDPYARNPSGACGLGQSLPCSKLLSVCGSLDNVSCQIDWVRQYAVATYGSVSAAKAFWQVHSWY